MMHPATLPTPLHHKHTSAMPIVAAMPRVYTLRRTVAAFLITCYEDWTRCGSIDSDPSIKKGPWSHTARVQAWFAWLHQANTMVQRYVELTEHGLNPYLGQLCQLGVALDIAHEEVSL